MPDFTVEVSGDDEVYVALAAIASQVSDTTGETVKLVLNQVARQERNMLSLGWHPLGTKTGSIPPEPPWRITGHLSRSVRVEKPVLQMFVWTGQMGPTAVYARIHELGGYIRVRHRGEIGPQLIHSYFYMPKRPHLMPAWQLVQPSVFGTFYRAWTRATRPPRI